MTALANQLASAKTARQTAMDDAQKAKDKAMAAMAAKLYAGIGAAPLTGHAVTINNETGAISVDPAGDPLTNQALTADKKTMVAANHGWEGKRHTASGTGVTGTYEAVVYSDVGEPTEGAKFSAQYSDNFNSTTGILDTATTEGTSSRVASSSFDQSAGVKTFEKGSNEIAVKISGTYHGVSGTYSCTPSDSSHTCAVQLAAQGFNLGGANNESNAFSGDTAEWTFKPTNPDAKVKSVADAIYASYGWWIHTDTDGDLTASAFVVDRGNVPDAVGLDGLQGTATYMGGAAGQYALTSATGGTNDAGAFTARAKLEADFSDNSITGTIDQFMGADGMSRDWSVELKEASLAATGGISRDAANDTVWTIGGNAAAASGAWSGSLQDNGKDGVPKVGSGTFHSTYGGDGRMVGAFGVNKQ